MHISLLSLSLSLPLPFLLYLSPNLYLCAKEHTLQIHVFLFPRVSESHIISRVKYMGGRKSIGEVQS
jgi:hypothetical protein